MNSIFIEKVDAYLDFIPRVLLFSLATGFSPPDLDENIRAVKLYASCPGTCCTRRMFQTGMSRRDRDFRGLQFTLYTKAVITNHRQELDDYYLAF